MKPSFLQLRIVSAIGILLLEVMLLSLMVDAENLTSGGLLALVLAQAGNVLRWIIVSSGLLILLLTNGFKHRIQALVSHYSLFSAFGIFILHQGSFFVLVFLTYLVFGKTETESFYGYLWVSSVLLTGLSWCLLIANADSWKLFLGRERKAIARAATGGAIIVGLGFYFQQFWSSMTEFTFAATHMILSLFYQDIIIDPSQNKLGVNEFWVYIAPVCSGIEGAVLALSIAAIYIYLSRDHIKFPHALIILPLAVILSIILNIFRIAALIIIGAEISPLIAIGSFHSVAGWIGAVLIALLIILVFSSWSWIQKNPDPKRMSKETLQSTDAKLAQAILIPFAIYLGSTLLGKAFSMDIDYLYPLKFVLTGSAILYFWRVYDIRLPDRLPLALFTGIVIAVIWLITVPENTQFNQDTDTALSAMPLGVMVAWGTIRLAGFWLLAPVVEELVFRAYLLQRLSTSIISNSSQPTFSLFALIVSSALFGLLHDAWLAGMLSGLLLAGLRYRSRSLSDCIVAHGTANILISVWAIYSGNWSLF